MSYILPDNDAKFLELIIRTARQLDPSCLIDIKTRLNTHTVYIQTAQEFKVRMLVAMKDLHHLFKLPFVATQFIKNRESLVSFELKTKL
jgi:hypothetical protein